MGEQSPYQVHIDRVTGYDLALLHHFQGLSRHLLFFSWSHSHHIECSGLVFPPGIFTAHTESGGKGRVVKL